MPVNVLECLGHIRPIRSEDDDIAFGRLRLRTGHCAWAGDMATEVIKQAAERMHERGERSTNMIRIREVTASRGKAMRAEPVSLLYERNRVLHRRGLDQLEGEMMSFSREWDRSVDGSPNRLDAMVWGLTRLSKVITHIPIA